MKIKISQLISNVIWMNYNHNKKFGLLKFHLGYGKFNLNSPKGYSLKIINAQTECPIMLPKCWCTHCFCRETPVIASLFGYLTSAVHDLNIQQLVLSTMSNKETAVFKDDKIQSVVILKLVHFLLKTEINSFINFCFS